MNDDAVAAAREHHGKHVRAVWLRWAREQPDAKPSWLVPWGELDEGQQEVDMRIGEALFNAGHAEGLEVGVAAAQPEAPRVEELVSHMDAAIIYIEQQDYAGAVNVLRDAIDATPAS